MARVETLTATWMSQLLKQAVEKVEFRSLKSAGGLSGTLHLLDVTFKNVSQSHSQTATTFVVKTTSDGKEGSSTAMGLIREALFYSDLAKVPELKPLVPHVLWSSSDIDTGRKLILMEDLSSRTIQTGYFFGSGSPLNWDKDLPKLTTGFDLTTANIVDLSFNVAAKLHATFWQSSDLLEKNWLRGVQWLHGKDEMSWKSAQQLCADAWASIDKSFWNERVIALVSASVAKANWNEYLGHLRKTPWTLVHGDFHPANVMITKTKPHSVIMLDFEMVGIGCGAQDLGQYMISHVAKTLRENVEQAAVKKYYDTLCTTNSRIRNELTWESCWHEYIHGGAARWMWLLPMLAKMCSRQQTTYFHDQVLNFCVFHGIDETVISMPRV